MKKVLFIDHDHQNTGSTVSLVYLIKAFLNENFKVVVFSPKTGIYLDNLKKLNVEVIQYGWKYFKTFNLNLYFSEPSSLLSVSGFILLFKNIIKFFVGIYATLKVINSVKPDIVYINEYVVVQSAVAARLKKVKSIIHIRSPYVKGQFGFRRNFIAFCITKFCDIIIAITKQEAKQIYSCMPAAQKNIHIVGEFLDENNFAMYRDTVILNKTYSVSQQKKIILTLAGILPHKGGLDFIKAADIVLQKKSDILFVVAGKVYNSETQDRIAYYEEAMAIAQKPQNRNNILFVGDLSDPLPLIASCTMLVSPFPYSHFSRPLIEAWAQKKPIISTKTEHSLDLISDHEDGILVNIGDIESLANAMIFLAEDENLCTKLGNNGFNKAKSDFDARVNTKIIVEYALKLLS